MGGLVASWVLATPAQSLLLGCTLCAALSPLSYWGVGDSKAGRDGSAAGREYDQDPLRSGALIHQTALECIPSGVPASP